MSAALATFDSSSPRVDARCKETIARLKLKNATKAHVVYEFPRSEFSEGEMKHLLEKALMPLGVVPLNLVRQVLVDPRSNPDLVAFEFNFDIV